MLKRSSLTCEVCCAKVSELRRGRCWGCYSQWVESRPVGVGAICCMCGDRRREHLKSSELLGTWVPICHNCSAMAVNMSCMPSNLGEIREALERDRRKTERRWGKRDSRVFRHNRRHLERRDGRDASEGVDDDMIIEISELVSDLERLACDESRVDLTSIQERPEKGDDPKNSSESMAS